MLLALCPSLDFCHICKEEEATSNHVYWSAGCVSSCRRDSLWPPGKALSEDTKVTVFTEWKAACLSTSLCVTVGQEALGLEIEVLIPLPHPCLLQSLTLNVNRSQIYFMKQIISIDHPSSGVILSYYFTAYPPWYGISAYPPWGG